MGIFKAYDIRGIYPSELDEETAFRLGRALVVFFKAKKLIVGRDVRLSSEALHASIVEGALTQGATVVDIGICSTPMLYFASREGDAVMVTASHSPKDYNGFKVCRKNAVPVGIESGLAEIEKLVAANKWQAATKGTLSRKDILKDYVADVARYANLSGKKPKIVVDAGNGAAGISVTPLAKALGIQLIPLFFEADGNFPGRGPNPLLEGATKKLQDAVKKHNADCGVAYDADCDRVFFVDETGALIQADLITALIAEELLKKKPNATILYDLRSSRSVKEHIDAVGGKAMVTRVGHSFIKQTMREQNAIFAGELSGHYYFQSNNYADSGDITMVLLASLLASSGKKLSQLVTPLKKYVASGEINFEVKDKDGVIHKLHERFSSGTQSTLDGLSVDYDDWWFNVRPSNTEPLLRLNVEADNKKLLDEKVKELTSAIGGKRQ